MNFSFWTFLWFGSPGRLLKKKLFWDPSCPLENTKSPHPENPGKLLKIYNLALPRPVLKITEKLPKKVTKSAIFGIELLKNYSF